MPRTTQPNFVNRTSLEDKQAERVVEKLRKVVINSESDRQIDVQRAEEAIAIWKNEMWSEKDIEYFQEKFNVTPYQIPIGRSPLNRLVAQQRGSRYEFDIVPTDPYSYDRLRNNRDEYIRKYGDEFDTERQAGEYFDRYYDDEYAQAIETRYENIRSKHKTKYVESQCFENMLITGLDFLKTTYTTQHNPDGEIKTERKSVRQMLWDHGSVSPTLDDIEYIGEVHRFYKQDLIQLFPEMVEDIENLYEDYTNLSRGMYNSSQRTQNWQHFYDFDTQRDDVRLKMVELWYKDTEERYQLIDNDTGSARLIKYGLEEEQIWDYVKELELDTMIEAMERGELSPDFFARSEQEVREDIEQEVQEKYSLRTTQTYVWYKALFTHHGLFEFKRSPLPHGKHPYTPAFAQFTEGWYTGLVDDVRDILLAYNKAFMFREIMLANGAKGALLVDRGTVNKSGYSMDEIREMWTEIGGVIDLELRGGRRLQDVFQNITTISDGLVEIRSILNDLEAKLYRIMGVNDAMLGNIGAEAPASQVRQAIQQGQSTNGVIFDNFNRALETHTHDKVIPLVITELMSKQPNAIRSLADNRERWIELTYDEEFEVFADAMMSGEYQTKLITKEPDKQLSAQHSAMLLELAASRPDAVDIEAALEFSDISNVGKFLKRNRELLRRRQRDQQLRMVDLKQVQKMMAKYGIDAETAEKMLEDMRKERVQQIESSKGGGQEGQGNSTIQKLSAENSRQADIEQANTIQNT